MRHKFVEYIPEKIDENTIYISKKFGTATHKCPCNCGREIVTPLSPTDWRLIYDGKTISLHPSILNRHCKSHYWIINNQIKWA